MAKRRRTQRKANARRGAKAPTLSASGSGHVMKKKRGKRGNN